jgi:hypothetical protein
VQNDYADQWSETFDDPQAFLKRRTTTYQAFYEHMPGKPGAHGRPGMRIYDRFTFGALAEIAMLDGRQYRSREACYGPPGKGRAAAVSLPFGKRPGADYPFHSDHADWRFGRVCAGFSDAWMRSHALLALGGVREAPRHEIA